MNNFETHPPPLTPPHPLTPLVDLWLRELDIKEFFPNLDRVGTFEAVSEIHKEVAERLNKRMGADGLEFAIHKRHRELDRLGRGGQGFLLEPYLRGSAQIREMGSTPQLVVCCGE